MARYQSLQNDGQVAERSIRPAFIANHSSEPGPAPGFCHFGSKPMIIHACLLDVAAATLMPVTLDSANTLAGLYSLIGCSLVDIVRISDSHTLYCDDEGLTDGLRGFTLLDGHSAPLAGNLVIAGTNAEGETTSVTEPLETFATMLTVVRPVLDPIFETSDMPGIFGSRVKTFSARLERSRPHIVGRCNAPAWV